MTENFISKLNIDKNCEPIDSVSSTNPKHKKHKENYPRKSIIKLLKSSDRVKSKEQPEENTLCKEK